MTTRTVHIGLSREECEDLLYKNKQDGSFLVRESETYKGTYSLSVIFSGIIKHYRIKQRGNCFYIEAEQGVENTYHSMLEGLIDEYKKRGDKNGLVCALRYAILPEVVQRIDSEPSDDEVEDEDYDYVVRDDMLVAPKLHYIADEFQRRLQTLDLSVFDGDFVRALHDYASKHCMEDAAIVNGGTEQTARLHEVIMQAGKDLVTQLDLFRKKVDCIQQLYGKNPPPIGPILRARPGSRNTHSQQLEQLKENFKTTVVHLEKAESNSVSALQQLLKSSPDNVQAAVRTRSPDEAAPVPQRRQHIKPQEFKAQLYKHFCKNSAQVHITVDVQGGKVSAVRPNQNALDEHNVYSWNIIEQLVKNTKVNSVVDMYLDGKSKPETYQFEDMRRRELFCQLVSHMKLTHSDTSVVEQLSLFIGTWNMGDESPTWKLDDWFKCQGRGQSMPELLADVPFDMYVIGCQESSISERDWMKKIQEFLSNKFPESKWSFVVAEALWQIRICVFVKTEYRNLVTNIQKSREATGIANTLANKGGVGVSFSFRGTSLCFICAHLTSGSEKNDRRNNNYKDILKGLKLGPRNLGSECDLTNKFHHMFFFGDLNYRLDGLEPQVIISKIERQEYHVLKGYDQLQGSIQERKVFVGFNEADICFAPTYRYEKNSLNDKYVWQKKKKTGIRINAPSYTDRVLWRSYPNTYIENVAYGCVQSVNVSDHKPVFAAFKLGIINDFLSPQARPGIAGNTKVVLKELSAHVKMKTKVRMTMEIMSGCFDQPKKLPTNVEFKSYIEGFCSPCWTAKSALKLDTLFEDLDFLEDQHLIMIVKNSDLMDHYGSAVVSLRNVVSGSAAFEVPLVYNGEYAGLVNGTLALETHSNHPLTSPRRASINFIYYDTDEMAKYRNAGPLVELPETSLTRTARDVADAGEYSEIPQQPTQRKVTSEKPPSPTKAIQTSKRADAQLYSEVSHKFKLLAQEGVRSPVTRPPPSRPLSEPRANPDSAIYSESEGDPDNIYDALYECTSLPEPQLLRQPQTKRKYSGHKGNTVSATEEALYSDSAPARAFKMDTGPAKSPTRVASTTDMAVYSDPSCPPQEKVKGADSGRSSTVITHPTEDLDEVDGHSCEEDSSADPEYYNMSVFGAGPEDKSLNEPPTPPVLPPRSYQAHGDQYVRVVHPASVREWLTSLGLGQHVTKFHQGGWDSMSYIGDITDRDLIAIGVELVSQRERIIKSLISMKKKP